MTKTPDPVSHPSRADDIRVLAAALVDRYGAQAMIIAEGQIAAARGDARTTWEDILAVVRANPGSD